MPVPILWAASANKMGLHPVKLRITHQGERHYYQIYHRDKQKLFLGTQEYDSIVSTDLKKLRGKNRELREIIDDSTSVGKLAIEKVTRNGKAPFSFTDFEKEFLGQDSDRRFLEFFQNHIDVLTKKGQAGTARTYSSAYSAFKRFLNGKDIDPVEITLHKLSEFDTWLREKHLIVEGQRKIHISGKNDTSVSIYMRCIRSIYNEMAANDEYLEKVYPFSRTDHDKKYKIPTSTGSKGQALSIKEINKFVDGKVDGPNDPGNPMYLAKRLFLFSFLAQGVNFKDMAYYRNSTIAIAQFH